MGIYGCPGHCKRRAFENTRIVCRSYRSSAVAKGVAPRAGRVVLTRVRIASTFWNIFTITASFYPTQNLADPTGELKKLYWLGKTKLARNLLVFIQDHG